MNIKRRVVESGFALPQRFLTPREHRTPGWTIYDDIRFFIEHPELFDPPAKEAV